MDVRDDFFFNASFTLFSGPFLHEFKTASIPAYKKTLLAYLQRVSEASDLDDDLKGTIELKWKRWGSMAGHTGLSPDVQYSVDMLFIRYNRSLHRLCIITRNHLKNRLEKMRHGTVVLANGTPEVLDVCRYWISKQFDASLIQFNISQDVLFNEYDRYLRASARASGFGMDSELVFTVEDTVSKKLKDLTITVSGTDLPNYLANG